uniref:Heat shock 70 kDa protein 12B-like isoform X2 n=1 Tax=Crassostrea virginica TaxID=6565 RepID=A0A8B8CV38_CRAVI|nr:heat shock 70 kDa protein 12B-like isoform X2 [Crassostrea virginica]
MMLSLSMLPWRKTKNTRDGIISKISKWTCLNQYVCYLRYLKTVSRDLEIKDIDGKCVNALRVFAHCIQFLRSHFLERLKERNFRSEITEDKIRYIVTVPAIWSDAAKQLMKEAAIEAGISQHRLMLAYEPEAAAVYCSQRIPQHLMIGEEDSVKFLPNQSYVLVDLGGGTVDITVQSVSSTGKLENLYKACGGPWGGNNINRACIELYTNLFGEPTMAEFCRENIDDFFDILQKIEIVKRNISTRVERTVALDVPMTLIDKHRATCGNTPQACLQQVIKDAKLQELIEAKWGYKIYVKNAYFIKFFQEICKNTVDMVKDIIRNEQQCKMVKSLVLVGGFAESEVVQHIFKESFPEYIVRIPLEAGLVVLKGAVIFGFDNSVIQSRKCPYTYGISLLREFNPKTDDPAKSVMMGNQLMADSVFETIFEVGEILTIGKKQNIKVKTNHESNDPVRSEPMEIEVFSSTEQSPKYTTDPTCHRRGIISVPPPNGQWPELVEGRIEVEVTGTDNFQITYGDGATGLSTSGTIDFLLIQNGDTELE